MGPLPIQLARHVQDHGCCWHHGPLSPDDVSGPISAQCERDPVILQATATHWRYGCIKCSGYASQRVDRHCYVGKILTLCCCKYGTTTGSIIPSRQRNANEGTARFQSSGVWPFPDCPVANSCLSKPPKFRLERNLLRRDEVFRKRSSRGVVLLGLPNPAGSVRDVPSLLKYVQYSTYCRIVALEMPNNVSCRHASGKHTYDSLTLLKRHSRPKWNDVWHWFSKIFFQFLCLR